MATAEKRVVTDATGQAMLAELRKIPGVMNPVPVEKGGTGVTTPQEILELIGAQPKFDFNVEEQLNAAVKSVNEIKPDAHGNVQIMRVPMADNFTSDEAQVVSGAFIERTTGGDASISDGTATLGVLYGNSIRSGYTAESKNMEVQLAGRFDDSIPLSATISWDAYKTAVNYISTNKTFTYTSNWNENPETYGITLSGTPVSGDVINVYYIAENRGTIANATPTSFVETNWNLYDFEKGYARVLKYSDEHGFKIGGYYTGVSFATTIEGDKTVITPDSDGFFDVPSDGYVFVAGGNNTDTYVLMTWSDWHDGYTGDYLTYAESVIDFSELMGNVFPFGMCAIGITMDEINFNDKTAIVRIERVAYTTENRILAEQSGREFVYDADWIYSVKETPDRVRFNIENDLVVYDHGTEFFTGTEVPVLAYELFGQNLKDKLRREVVAVTPQNFSAAQKAQARENIEAAWNSEVIKSINNKVPDANGNITIVEGQSNASYGSYRIDPVIPPAAWTLVNGQYQVAYFDPLIKSTMTGAETWLDDSDVMLGATHFSTVDGALMIVTEVQPTDTWRLHVLLAENGATVLEEVNNKAEESTVAIVETGDTAFHAITAGQYVMWNGALYKATVNIASGATLTSTGNGANLSAVTGGAGNDLKSEIDQLNTKTSAYSFTNEYSSLLDMINDRVTTKGQKLPFSFMKAGSSTLSDTPAELGSAEFAGIVYGQGPRLEIEINQYGRPYKWYREIWNGAWRISWNRDSEAEPITVTSLETFKSALLEKASSMRQYGIKFVTFWVNGNVSGFNTGKNYSGNIVISYKDATRTYFDAILTAYDGDVVAVGYNNGTWAINSLYSNIAQSVIGSSPIAIASGTNLNTITTPGYYVCAYNSAVETLSNCPVSIAFTMQVIRGTVDGNAIQILTDYYSGNTYKRIKHSTTWESWEELALNRKFTWTSLGETVSSNISTAPPSSAKELLIVGYKTSISAWETVSIVVPLIGSSQNCSVVGKDTTMVVYITSSGQVAIPSSSGSNITKFTVYYR